MFTTFHRRACLVLAVAGLLVVFPTATDAGKKTKPPPTAQERQGKTEEDKDAYVNDLVMAYRLKELGEKQLEGKHPDPATASASLIAAATIFRRLSGVQLDTLADKPMIADDKGAEVTDPSDKAVEPPDLAQQATDLLQQAGALNTKHKLGLSTLIAAVEQGERDVFGGPKQISRRIQGRQWHTYHVQVVPGRPVHFTFRSSIPMRVSVVRSDSDNPYATGIIAHANTTFHPGPSKTGKVPLTIRVINESNKQSGSYQIFVN